MDSILMKFPPASQDHFCSTNSHIRLLTGSVVAQSVQELPTGWATERCQFESR
jgi:hypothetical protein